MEKRSFWKSFGVSFRKAWIETRNVVGRTMKSDAKKKENYDVSDEIILDFIRADPILNAAVMVTVDNVVPGIWWEKLEDTDEAEAQVKQAQEFAEMDNWIQRFRNIATNVVAFDDAYQEILGFPKFEGSAILDTTQIQIELGDDGDPKFYKQIIDGKIVARIPAKKIVHYKVNVMGDNDYGRSLIETALFSAAAKRFAEKFNASYFENHKARGVWLFPEKMGKKTYEEIVDLIIEAKKDPQKDLFLKGDGVDYKPFTSGEDMHFIEYLKYVREEIVVAVLVPPIMLGLPAGSNLANSDVQMQTFDRRVEAIQQAIEYLVNERLVKNVFKFDKIRFRFEKSNKRNLLRALEIANRMKGLATLNEAREEIGLPKLDPAIYPEADQILSAGGFGGNMFNSEVNRNSFGERGDQTKVLKMSDDPLPIKKKDEEKISNLLKNWADKVRDKLNAEIDAGTLFKKTKKQIADPDEVVKKVVALVTIDALQDDINATLAFGYQKGLESMTKALGRNFSPDSEALEFLKKYTFDLVKGINDRVKNNLRQILQRAVIQGQSIPQVKANIKKYMDREIANSETLARTELNRAGNQARLHAARESGIVKKKWISITKDSRTSPISWAMDSKYGSPEQAIPLEDKFKVIVNGEVIEGEAPPFHPNERDALIFVVGE